MKLSLRTKKAAGIGICLIVVGLFTACTTAPTPEPSPSPVVSKVQDAIVGEWQSQTTDDAILSVGADGTFSVSGLCVVSGKWKVDGSTVAATADSIPDIGGCADTFLVNRATISAIVLLDDEELQLVDDDGERDAFRKLK